MKKQFSNAMELAKWINSNIKDECIQEQLMLAGIRNNYIIYI